MPADFTTDMYDAVNAKAEVAANPPAGLIYHALGTSDDGAVIIDVWESEDAFESFRGDRLNPAMESIVGSEVFAAMPTPEREFYAVHETVQP
jgi:hypothetical protein